MYKYFIGIILSFAIYSTVYAQTLVLSDVIKDARDAEMNKVTTTQQENSIQPVKNETSTNIQQQKVDEQNLQEKLNKEETAEMSQ